MNTLPDELKLASTRQPEVNPEYGPCTWHGPTDLTVIKPTGKKKLDADRNGKIINISENSVTCLSRECPNIE